MRGGWIAFFFVLGGGILSCQNTVPIKPSLKTQKIENILFLASKTKEKIERFYKSFHDSIESKEGIYNSLLAQGLSSKNPDFKKVREILTQLLDLDKKAYGLLQKVQRTFENDKLLTKKNKNLVLTVEQTQKKFHPEKYSIFLEERESLIQEHNRLVAQYEKELYRNKVYEVRGMKLWKQLQPQILSLTKRFKSLKNEIKNVETKMSLLSSDTQTMNKDEMNKILILMNDVSDLERQWLYYKNTLKLELKKKEKIYVYKEMASFSAQAKLKLFLKRLKALELDFNTHVQNLFGG